MDGWMEIVHQIFMCAYKGLWDVWMDELMEVGWLD